MTERTTWIIDKSALVRLGSSRDAATWAERIERGLVCICPVTLLEVGFSARSAHDLAHHLSSSPISAMPIEHTTPAMEVRAMDVQRLLAGKGRYRAPSIPDLLIAATAELSSRVVLHVDKDFDLIAGVTHQPVERLRQ